MPRCAACDTVNPDGFRFCGHCGRGLEGGCPGCGYVNPPGQRFCGRCGTRADDGVGLDRAADIAQRRVATVMFADIVGFTTLAENLDPEALATRVDNALRAVGDVVVEHGGTIDKYLGDALMAVFGVPVAHDDDAVRAIAAALRIRDTGGDLRFSIGVNTGPVMVTAVGEGGDMTVIGDAVNVASRLQSAAGAGEILAGPLTAELVAGSFVLNERPPTVLKGRSQAVAVFEVEGHVVLSADHGEPSSALIGREAELQFLLSVLQRVAQRSRAQFVLLTGEAGVGKSRLAGELGRRAADDCAVVEAACPGYGALVGSRLAVELGRQLGDDGEAAALSLDEQGVMRLRRLIAARTAARPLLLVIDNLHNVPAGDLEPLAQLCARLTELPVTVLLVGRPQPVDWLTRFPAATTLHLDPLGSADAVHLAQVLAEGLPLSAAELAAVAGGNPLHLHEMARLLALQGGLAGPPGEPGPGDRMKLPATLQAVLAARLDALPSRDKAVLQDVAVFSDGATLSEIAAVSGRDPRSSLDQLLNAGLVCEQDDRFEVREPLLREVAYEQLPHSARGDRHRRAAAVATTTIGRARQLGLAARYLADDATLRHEAAQALAVAGNDLLARSRLRDGISLTRRAIELGHEDAGTLLALAQAELNVGRVSQATELLDRIAPDGDERLAAELVHTRGNATGSVEMLDEAASRWRVIGDQSKLAWAFANRGMIEFRQARIDDAAASHEQALTLFRGAGDRVGAAAAGQALALALPDDPRLPSFLADGLKLAEETGDLIHARNAMIPITWSHFLRSQLGGDEYTTSALASAQRLVEVCAELGDAPFELQGLCILAIIDRLAGRLDAADVHMDRAMTTARRLDARPESLVAAAAFMLAMARNGDPAQCPPPPDEVSPLALIAETVVIEAMLLAGAIDAAIERLAAAAPGTANVVETPFFARLVGAVRGGVLVLAGRHDEAEMSLRLARDGARAVHAYPNEVATTALLAEVRWKRGDGDGARQLLGTISTDPGGIAGALLARGLWLLGDAGAGSRAGALADDLAAPGLAPPHDRPQR